MWLGRFILGQFVPVPVWCEAIPSAAPIVSIYNASAVKVFASKMPPADFYGVDGYFVLPVRLSSSFAVGDYSATINYTASATARLQVVRFTIVEGGSADGAVVSGTYYRRPHADFLVTRLDSDQRQLLKAPKEAT